MQVNVIEPPGALRGDAVPRLPGGWLVRPRILEAVRRGVARSTLLVVAGAGTGKTTAVAEWFREEGAPDGAWIALTDAHNDPDHLVRALRHTLGPVGEAAPPDLHPEGWIAQLDRVLDDVRRAGREAVLVLDDAHVVVAPAAEAALQHLLLCAPACLRLIVTTRAWKPIGITHLRMRRGAVAVVPGTHLAFTAAEEASYLAAQDRRVGDEAVAAQHEATGGWAAAVVAAAAHRSSWAGPTGPTGPAADAVVGDLLQRRVLDDLDEGFRSFVTLTSVVDRLTPELAEALTGDQRAAERFERLVYDGTLLGQLEEPGLGCRYHPVASALLRARLRLDHPGRERDLLQVAARWYDERGAPGEADVHAVRSGDLGLLATLRCRRWVRATVEGSPWPGAAGEAVTGDPTFWSPELGVLQVASAVALGDEVLAIRARSRVDEEVLLEDGEGTSLAGARLLMDAVYGRAFGADERARAAVEVLADASGSHPGLRPFAQLVTAELHLGDGAFGDAARTLELVAAKGAGAGREGVLEEVAALAGLVQAALVHLPEADRHLAEAGPPRGDRAAALATMTKALLAGLRGSLRNAGSQLAAGDPGALDGSRVLRLGWLALEHAAGTSCARGDLVTNGELLGDPFAEQLLVGFGYLEGRDIGGRTVTLGGDAGAALLRARRALDGRRWRDASSLGMEVLRAGGAAHPCTTIEAAVVVGASSLHRGDEVTALAMLRTALRSAEVSGLRAPLLRQPAALRALLERWSIDVVMLSRDALELRDQLVDTEAPAFIEPLTERERAVLRCLPSLMSNADIAFELVLSVNTVKTHLKAVYRKLGVTRRREALARARQLELL